MGNRLAGSSQPAGHQLHLGILGGLDAGGEVNHFRACSGGRVTCDFGHLDGLFVVGDHPLGELDVRCVQAHLAR